jgi:hypothetical protein
MANSPAYEGLKLGTKPPPGLTAPGTGVPEPLPPTQARSFPNQKLGPPQDEALALASRAPCDPRTLTRAARDLAGEQPAFAVGAGLLALYWLVLGDGYEITGAHVCAANSSTLKAAERNGNVEEIRERIKKLVASEAPGGFVRKILGRELGL